MLQYTTAHRFSDFGSVVAEISCFEVLQLLGGKLAFDEAQEYPTYLPLVLKKCLASSIIDNTRRFESSLSKISLLLTYHHTNLPMIDGGGTPPTAHIQRRHGA